MHHCVGVLAQCVCQLLFQAKKLCETFPWYIQNGQAGRHLSPVCIMHIGIIWQLEENDLGKIMSLLINFKTKDCIYVLVNAPLRVL